MNVAARLQAKCPLGGICVTRPVRDHVRDRLDLALEGLGTLSPAVEALVLGLDTAAIMPKSVERSVVRDTRKALPLPDRPSIAVLAFTNMSDGLAQEYSSGGIAAALSHPLTLRYRPHPLVRQSRSSRRTDESIRKCHQMLP